MVVLMSTGAHIATAGKNNNTIPKTLRLTPVNSKTSAGSRTALISIRRKTGDIPSILISSCCQGTEVVTSARLTLI